MKGDDKIPEDAEIKIFGGELTTSRMSPTSGAILRTLWSAGFANASSSRS
jgi:hypothetical protein